MAAYHISSVTLSTCVPGMFTYIDSFLINSLKPSLSRTSGSPWKANRWTVGDGDRGGSLAPGCGFDLTRTGMSLTLSSTLQVVSILGLVMICRIKETMATNCYPGRSYGRVSNLSTDLELALNAQATPQSQVRKGTLQGGGPPPDCGEQSSCSDASPHDKGPAPGACPKA